MTIRHPDKPLRHPGALFREVVLPSLGISISSAADRLHISRQPLHRIFVEDASVTPELALRLGKFCGNGPDLWLRMQETYYLWRAERKLRDELTRIETVRAA